MKNVKYLFICQFLFLNLNAQKFVVDSSFGNKGTVDVSTPKLSGFGGVALDSVKNIYLFGGSLLYYFDSSGIIRSNLNRFNPDTFLLNSKEQMAKSLIMTTNKDVFFSEAKFVMAGMDLSVQKININQISNSSFDNSASLLVGNNYDYGIGFGHSGESYLMVSKDYKAINSLVKIKLIRTSNNGAIDSSIFILPDRCLLSDCGSEFTNIVEDSKGNLYFGITFFDSDSSKMYIVKTDSKFDLDNSYGDQGFLKIHSESISLSQRQELVSVLVGKNDDLYLFMGEDPEKLNIRKLKEDGSFDLSFGSSGSFDLIHHNLRRSFSYYSKENDEIMLFAYDNLTKNSILLGLNSNGQLNSEYLNNGRLLMDGFVIDFKPFGVGQYLVLQTSDVPFDRTMQLGKIKLNPISSNSNSTLNLKLKAIPNPFKESTTIFFPEDLDSQIKYIEVFGIDGKLLNRSTTTNNSILLTHFENAPNCLLVRVLSKNGLSGVILVNKYK